MAPLFNCQRAEGMFPYWTYINTFTEWSQVKISIYIKKRLKTAFLSVYWRNWSISEDMQGIRGDMGGIRLFIANGVAMHVLSLESPL